MRKVIGLIFLLASSTLAFAIDSHLQELKELFPYALLTDDYGILNKDDLKINQCIAEPSAFSEKEHTPYPYWKCFELKSARMICEGKKYSAEDKSRMTMLVISGFRDGELNEYIARRPMKLKTCRLYLKDWKKLTKNEINICISGDLINSESTKDGKKLTWIFDRYKTKKGCDSYFSDACIFDEKNKETCVVK